MADFARKHILQEVVDILYVVEMHFSIPRIMTVLL